VIIGDVDDPRPATDLKTAERDGIARIQLALGEAATLLGIHDGRCERHRAQQDRVTGVEV
jgi:hypothetical protein